MKLLGSIITTTAILFSVINNSSAQEVTIEGLTWSTKNLDVSTFRNGDVIPEAKSDADWLKAGEEGTPAWCYYENDLANGKKYGKLYNFYAVVDERGIAPEGWRVATYYEWEALNNHLGGSSYAGKKLKAVSGWTSNENGTNESGINAMPGGCRYFNNFGDYGENSSFGNIGAVANFWTSTDEDGAWYKIIADNSYLDSQHKGYGMSVRCVKE